MPTAEADGLRGNLRHALRALRARNYALFFVGHGLSLVGTWMQSVALGLLVWKLTGQEIWLGLVGFASQVFSLTVAPLAGVFSDRWNRHRILLMTQTLAMVQASALAGLTLTGTIRIGHVLALAAFLGLVNALDIPTRQAFLVRLVQRQEDLPNAIALNSFIFNSARLVGPMIAGLLIPLIGPTPASPYAGEGACFALNAVSYLAILAALLAMRLPPWTPSPESPHVLHSLKEGLRYGLGFLPIRAILLMVAAVSLFAGSYNVLVPAMAAKVLHGGHVETPIRLIGRLALKYENTVGLLIASSAVGALAGAMFLASRRSILGFSRNIPLAASALAVGLAGFALSPWVWLSAPLLLLVGFGFMVHMASCNTILQTIVEEDKRGRLMSLYTAAFMGTVPFGSLWSGALAAWQGPSVAILCGAGVVMIAASLFARRLPVLGQQVQPIYRRMGLAPEPLPLPKAPA